MAMPKAKPPESVQHRRLQNQLALERERADLQRTLQQKMERDLRAAHAYAQKLQTEAAAARAAQQRAERDLRDLTDVLTTYLGLELSAVQVIAQAVHDFRPKVS